MKIALCVKQVPDTSDIKWTENNTMQREGVESIINPYDVYAVEIALKLKRIYGAEITVFTMGPLQAEDMLKDILALGCDNGVLISDRKFAGADTYATGKTLSAAIKKVLPDFDLILCGQFAIDGDTAQTGPCVAGMLNIPQVTYVKDVENVDGNVLFAKRVIDEGLEFISVQTPVLICILKSEFEPTRATIDGIIEAQDKKIKLLSLEDLGLDADSVGLKGSPTYVAKAFRPEIKHKGMKIKDDVVNVLYDKINEVLNG